MSLWNRIRNAFGSDENAFDYEELDYKEARYDGSIQDNEAGFTGLDDDDEVEQGLPDYGTAGYREIDFDIAGYQEIGYLFTDYDDMDYSAPDDTDVADHAADHAVDNAVDNAADHAADEDQEFTIVYADYNVVVQEQKRELRKKRILQTSAVLLAVGLFGWTAYRLHPPGQQAPAVPQQEEESRVVSLPVFDEAVLLCSPSAKKLYDGVISVSEAIGEGNGYQPFAFAYQFRGKAGKLLLSASETFEQYTEFVLSPYENKVMIDNLKTGTTYYYRVLFGEEVYEGSFQTAQSTRFVSIPGISNTRDIGGYTTQDGHGIRQGLLIRGTELDGLVQPSSKMPSEAAPEVQNTFGFVYDLDLRSESIFDGEAYRSPLGENVRHRFYDSPMYGDIFKADGPTKVRDIFKDLAKPENYPMYLHCTHGTDRTGTIVFLLQGLLNMSEEDMLREYRLTAFSNPSLAASDQMQTVIDGLQDYAGETLQQKIESYLLEAAGLTAEEIISIRSIFLEK